MITNSWKDIIQQMVAIRNAQGISQEQLAFKIGCHPSLVHKWEQHKRVPSGFMFSCWADALGAQIKIQ
jgi:DNA-binding transcriptional regulator YiaG|tara:strand:+ start:767 stop:970 length:204 start_codon:yes stop_codon:yes gene_type:complete